MLADDGARVTEAAPDAPYPTQLWNDIALPEGFASEGPLLARVGRGLIGRDRGDRRGRPGRPRRDYLDAQERRRSTTPRRWAEFFESYDVLLTPVDAAAGVRHRRHRPTTIDGMPVDPFFDDWCALALPANLTGCPPARCPRASTPTACRWACR